MKRARCSSRLSVRRRLGRARESNRKAWPRDRARAAKSPQYWGFDVSLSDSTYFCVAQPLILDLGRLLWSGRTARSLQSWLIEKELADPVDIKPLFGLGGVLIAAMTSEFNDQVTSIALTDVRGALGISHDPGTWIESLYVSAEIIGMAISPWLLMTFTLRRWTLFSIALFGASSALIPFSPNIEAIYGLRLLQRLAGSLIIPLLMTTAFRVLTPNIRLYGLAVYALTATFTPALASTVAALWTDIVDWRFVFWQTIPLSSLAGVLVWYCLHQDQPRYERFRMLDWRGALLLVIGTGALSTMLYQG